MADLATQNVVSKGWPILELNIQPIIRAARTMKAFKHSIVLHQSLDTPIAIFPSSIEAYTLSPWNKTNICHNSSTVPISCDDKRTRQDDNRHGARTDAVSSTKAGDKQNLATPNSNLC